MKWYTWLICAFFIITGIFASIDGFKMLTAKSNTTGDYVYVDNSTVDIFKQDLVGIEFKTTSDSPNVYTWTKSFEHIKFDGLRYEYFLTVNNLPGYEYVQTAGAIKTNFLLDYKNTDGNIITTSNLLISISFFESFTVVKLSIEDINNSLINLNNYIDNNGFSLKVVKVV